MRRTIVWAALLVSLAAAQENDPFKGRATRAALDPEGRVKITVPEAWKDMEIAGTWILHLRAPTSHGGHDCTVAREDGQSDVDKQRDRYLQHDGGRFPNGDVQKVSEPFFGYRIRDEAKDAVLVRGFVDDGPDGLVISVQSRHRYYDQHYRELVDAVVASVGLAEGAERKRAESESEVRRLYDPEARVSLVATALWKPIQDVGRNEILVLGLKGSKSGPRLTVTNWGSPGNAALTLTRIFTQWKRVYTGIHGERIGNDPPRMLVKNRKEDSVDYFVAFAQGDEGYTLHLTVREGSYEKMRSVADDVAATVCFTDGAWREPQAPEGGTAYRRSHVIHADPGLVGAVTAVERVLPAFEKHWKRIGVGDSKKKPPVHVQVVPEEKFAETASHFGAPPAAYDRLRCVVVSVPPPAVGEGVALWRGALYAALAEAALHRDLPVAAPPWLRAGLAACMEGAGIADASPEEGHRVFAPLIELKTATDSHRTLDKVLGLTNADLLLGDGIIENQAYAWAYTHFMLYGKGMLPSLYKRWTKELERAEGAAPEFDLRSYDDAQGDLKKHVQKRWGK